MTGVAQRKLFAPGRRKPRGEIVYVAPPKTHPNMKNRGCSGEMCLSLDFPPVLVRLAENCADRSRTLKHFQDRKTAPRALTRTEIEGGCQSNQKSHNIKYSLYSLSQIWQTQLEQAHPITRQHHKVATRLSLFHRDTSTNYTNLRKE